MHSKALPCPVRFVLPSYHFQPHVVLHCDSTLALHQQSNPRPCLGHKSSPVKYPSHSTARLQHTLLYNGPLEAQACRGNRWYTLSWHSAGSEESTADSAVAEVPYTIPFQGELEKL